MVEKSPEVASTIDSSIARWRRRVCNPGADFGLTHLNSKRIRPRKRFDRHSAGSMKSRHLDQNLVGANSIVQYGTLMSTLEQVHCLQRDVAKKLDKLYPISS